MKLAEALSPITKKLDEIRETTQKIGDFINKSQPETHQLAIENSQPKLPMENNQADTQPGVLFDVSLEKYINKYERKTKRIFSNKIRTKWTKILEWNTC